MKLLKYIDQLIVILIGYIGIIGSVGAAEWNNITITQMFIQILIAFLLCLFFGKIGFRTISLAIIWHKRDKAYHKIFYGR